MTGVRWGRIGAAFGVLAAVAGAIAYACAGGGYETSWDARQSAAILSPANDTRTNLLLLLADRDGTRVADPAQMAKGIVPIEFSWKVMQARLSPPQNDDLRSAGQWEEPDGSRCHSNPAGASSFVEALHNEPGLPAADRTALAAARDELKRRCAEAAGVTLALDGVQSPAGRAFSAYLVGARLFYAGEFGGALNAFHGAASASQPWVREGAAYMLARTALNQAQLASFTEYGDLAEPAKRDRAAIDAAGAAFNAYLNAYPKGRYAGSARGLLRRVAWLGGDQQRLGSAYSALLANAAARDGGAPNLTLIAEIDRKLLPPGDGAGVTDPILLAVVDLMRLRQDGRGEYDWGYRGAKLERAELEAQRPHFRSHPALFAYLLAAEAFYQRKQPREVLALIPDAAHQPRFSYLEFSRQMLRGFALEAVKDRNARAFWLSLLPGANQPYQRGAVELALANHDRAAGPIESLFAANSPLRHPLVRQKLLEDNAGAALLRQQARTVQTPHEREASLYLLLAGELHHGLYADFLKDVAMVGPRQVPEEGRYYGGWDVGSYDPEYSEELGPPPLEVFGVNGSNDLAPCPDIRTTVTSLSANPAAIRPRLCLAEFIRRKGFDQWNEQYVEDRGLVTRTRNGFPGKPLERIDIYRAVVSSGSASADDKAFALNRAVRCFAPAGSSTCGGNDIPVEQRRAWFNQLKRDYPNSTWARDLKYYW